MKQFYFNNYKMYAIRAERGACRPGGMRHVTSGRNAARATLPPLVVRAI